VGIEDILLKIQTWAKSQGRGHLVFLLALNTVK
jgi:hypothetical protein